MLRDNVRIWRSLLQLGQATYAVLEREVPESEGVPAHGLAVLRLLRWHEGKTLSAIAAFVGVTVATMQETVDEMLRLGLVRHQLESKGMRSVVFELAPQGLDAANRIIAAQRNRIERSVARLPTDQHEMAATILESLSYELVADSAGFAITCAECWAFSARDCVKSSVSRSCAFLRAERSDLDPDLIEGMNDCPSLCSVCPCQHDMLGMD